MSMTRRMKQFDLLPVLRATFSYVDTKQQLDIPTNTPVRLKMRPVGGTTLKVDGAASVLSSTGGVVTVEYTWAGTDTDTAGDFDAEFVFAMAGGELTAPTSGYLRITIEPDLG